MSKRTIKIIVVTITVAALAALLGGVCGKILLDNLI